MARLGGYGAENTGKAWFTDVSLEQVETVPVGEGGCSIWPHACAEPKHRRGRAQDGEGEEHPLLIGAAWCLRLAAAAGARPDGEEAERARRG